jgi:hypothetical protein
MIKQRISDIGDVILKKSNNEKLPYIEIGDIDVETKKYIRKDKPAVKGAIKAEKDHVIISKVRFKCFCCITNKRIDYSKIFILFNCL